MPRASAYRHAAASLRHASARLADLALRHRNLGPERIAAIGPVAELHGDAVDEARRQLALASDELRRLAGLCERRALVCDDYARRVGHHRSLPPLERLMTPPPVRPADWVDA